MRSTPLALFFALLTTAGFAYVSSPRGDDLLDASVAIPLILDGILFGMLLVLLFVGCVAALRGSVPARDIRWLAWGQAVAAVAVIALSSSLRLRAPSLWLDAKLVVAVVALPVSLALPRWGAFTPTRSATRPS